MDDGENFFTKRIKIPPSKYNTDTDTLKDGTLNSLPKRKRQQKDPLRADANKKNRLDLIESVCKTF